MKMELDLYEDYKISLNKNNNKSIDNDIAYVIDLLNGNIDYSIKKQIKKNQIIYKQIKDKKGIDDEIEKYVEIYVLSKLLGYYELKKNDNYLNDIYNNFSKSYKDILNCLFNNEKRMNQSEIAETLNFTRAYISKVLNKEKDNIFVCITKYNSKVIYYELSLKGKEYFKNNKTEIISRNKLFDTEANYNGESKFIQLANNCIKECK